MIKALFVSTAVFISAFAAHATLPSDCGIAPGGPGSYCNDAFYFSLQSGKSVIRVSGAMKGVVTEIVGYLEKAGVKPVKQELTRYEGPRALEIIAETPSLEMKLEPEEFVSLYAGGVWAGAMGDVNQLRFKGPVAEFLLNAMLKAGVQKHVYPGDPESYKASGHFIVCSYSKSIWGFSCEMTSPTDWHKY